MMRKIKVVEGFYDEKRIGNVKRENVRLSKLKGMVGIEVRVEDAHAFYMKNSWFRKHIGGKRRPVPGEKMVVIFYDEVKEVVKKVRKVKKDIDVNKVESEVVKETAVEDLRSMFAPLMPKRSEKRKGNSVSPSVIFKMGGKLIPGTPMLSQSIPFGHAVCSLATAA